MLSQDDCFQALIFPSPACASSLFCGPGVPRLRPSLRRVLCKPISVIPRLPPKTGPFHQSRPAQILWLSAQWLADSACALGMTPTFLHLEVTAKPLWRGRCASLFSCAACLSPWLLTHILTIVQALRVQSSRYGNTAERHHTMDMEWSFQHCKVHPRRFGLSPLPQLFGSVRMCTCSCIIVCPLHLVFSTNAS